MLEQQQQQQQHQLPKCVLSTNFLIWNSKLERNINFFSLQKFFSKRFADKQEWISERLKLEFLIKKLFYFYKKQIFQSRGDPRNLWSKKIYQNSISLLFPRFFEGIGLKNVQKWLLFRMQCSLIIRCNFMERIYCEMWGKPVQFFKDSHWS